MATRSLLLLLCSALLLTLSCNPSGSENAQAGKQTDAHAVKKYRKAASLKARKRADIKTRAFLTPMALDKLNRDQKACAANTSGKCSDIYASDCSTGDYCSDMKCIMKILCCHNITADIFDQILDDEAYYTTFSQKDWHYVVDAAACKQFIKFSADADSFYMELTDDTVTATGQLRSFYSPALMKGIAASGLDSIDVFIGKQTHSGAVILPFIVYYKGKDYYYDVSNDLP